jgi:hypothetical protein
MSAYTDELDLDAIEERVNEATPGPWETGMRGARKNVYPLLSSDAVAYTSGTDDADFIAHAREDVPKLIAEVRRLRAEVGGGVRGRARGRAEVRDE